MGLSQIEKMTGRYTSPAPTPVRTSLFGIPKGYRGTRKTLEHIQALIRQGAKDFFVRQRAIDILLAGGVLPKDYRGEIKALFEWVQRHVRYTKDPYRVEVLHSARRMLELQAGDCDDMTILLGALLEAIGHPIRLVIVGPDPLKPDFFSHIYLEVFHQGEWIPLDATMPFPMGWAPRTFVKKVLNLNRRQKDMSGELGLQGATTITPGPGIASLMRSIQGEAVPPRDARVREFYQMLRQRKLWGRNQWLQQLVRRIWRRGLAARPRPRTTRRLLLVLQRWGIATGIPIPAAMPPTMRTGIPPAWNRGRMISRPLPRPTPWGGQRLALRPLRRVAVRPVGRLSGG